jgi:hypothetical protein
MVREQTQEEVLPVLNQHKTHLTITVFLLVAQQVQFHLQVQSDK